MTHIICVERRQRTNGLAHRWTQGAPREQRSVANGTCTLTATPRDATGRTTAAVATDGPRGDDL